MVVNTIWLQNANPRQTSCQSSQVLIKTVEETMTAKAVLICRPNSHPFQDRSLILDQPMKVGRSVARARPASNNAIFDCKVLSRNHALLWYENGKFYLQDTKSSNGTFVNNQRLSKGSEESAPREVCSGDIVQFGVDVMENSRKVTHGCIVATLKLYLPDGKEAKASPSTSVVSPAGSVPLEDLYQLNQFVQEALQREQLLENKLATLQTLVESTREASEKGWKALIDEDRLLTRVDTLESQLQCFSQGVGEDTLRKELLQLQDEKGQYQENAKEYLKQMLKDKIEALQKLHDVERNLSNSEEECSTLRDICNQGQQELHDLAQKYAQQLERVTELSKKLMEYEEAKREASERIEQENQELRARLEEQLQAEEALQKRFQLLQNEIKSLQLRYSESKLGDGEKKIDQEFEIMKETDSTGTQVDIILERINFSDSDVGIKEDNENEAKIEKLRSQVEKLEGEVKESNVQLEDMKEKLEHLQNQALQNLNVMAQLESQIEETQGQEMSSSEAVLHLQDRIKHLESELSLLKPSQNNQQVNEGTEQESFQINSLQNEILKLQQNLQESKAHKRELENKLSKLQDKLQNARTRAEELCTELTESKEKIKIAQAEVSDKSAMVTRLSQDMFFMESNKEQLKTEIKNLKLLLSEQEMKTRSLMTKVDTYKKKLADAQNESDTQRRDIEKLEECLNSQSEGKGKLRQQLEQSPVDSSSNKVSYPLKLREKQDQVLNLEKEKENLQFSLTAVQMECERLNKKIANLTDICTDRNDKIKEMLSQESNFKDQIADLTVQLSQLKHKYGLCSENHEETLVELEQTKQQYKGLLDQTRMGKLRYLVAIAVLIVALLVAYFNVFHRN